METKNSTYNCLDILKFFFSICVIAMHTQLPLPESIGQLQGFAVPVFFALSGYLLFIKLTPPPTTTHTTTQSAKQESDIFNRYCLKMVKIYVAWSVVYFPIAIYEYGLWNTGIKQGFLLYIKDFFFRGGHYYSGHFWFVLSCIYGIVLIKFFRYIRCSSEIILFFGIIALLINCLIDYITRETFQTTFFTAIQQLISLTIRDGKLFVGFYYLALSMAVTKYRNKFSNILIWSICIGAFMIYTTANGIQLVDELCVSITAIFLIIGLSRISLADHKIYIWLRRASSTMYYSHNLFIFVWIILLGYEPGNTCFLITLIFTLILACIVSLIHEKTDKNNLSRKLLQLLSI